MRTIALRLAIFSTTVLMPGLAMALTRKVTDPNAIVPTSPIPEPTAIVLFGVGAAIVASAVRRQRAE